MVTGGSARHRRILKKCLHSPVSQTCRKHVFYSKGMSIPGPRGPRAPRSGTLRRRQLVKSRRGRYVSKKKSRRAAQAYHREDSQLRRWNEAARLLLETAGNYDEEPYVPFDEEPYVPFDEGGGGTRRSQRARRPIRPGEYSYHGTAARPPEKIVALPSQGTWHR